MLKRGQPGFECLVLARFRSDSVDLGEHEGKSIGIGRRAVVTSQKRVAGVDGLSVGRAGRAVVLERDRRLRARPAVEVADVRAAREQRLVLVLAVQVDERPERRGQLTDRRHLAGENAAATPVRADPAARDDLVPRCSERTLHERFGGARPNGRRVGPLPHQQLQRAEQSGLARSGLAGEHRHARDRTQARRPRSAQDRGRGSRAASPQLPKNSSATVS